MKKTAQGRIEFRGVRDIPLTPASVATTEFNQTGSWKSIEPYYLEFTSPCSNRCPAGKDIPQELFLLAEGKLDEALALSREANPFPAVCGRVCPHPCEDFCNRNDLGGPVSVHALERYVGDFGLEFGKPVKPLGSRKEKIAVIGAGPGGLSCAFYLGRAGYPVTMYDTQPQPGGLLRYGIPSFRLPKDILDRELKIFSRLPVRFESGRTLGKNLSMSDLKSFDATFIAVGRYRSRTLGVDSEPSFPLYNGIEVLDHIQRDTLPPIGTEIVVIGGGSTAFDCARSLKRLRKNPTIVYRRTQREMPAFKHDIEEAREEGIPIMFLASPVQIVCQGTRIREVVFNRMAPGPADASGRRTSVPIPGNRFTLVADSVIRAIGEEPDVAFLSAIVNVNEKGIQIDPSYHTRVERIFAGGDCAAGHGTVSHAIGDGRKAAAEIDRWLHGSTEIPVSLQKRRALDPSVVTRDQINAAYFPPLHRIDTEKLPPSRREDFSEIAAGLNSTSATREASRCLVCGTCSRCNNCMVFCPDNAIRMTDQGYSIDYRYCKGCGLCVQECPRKAMAMRESRKS